MAEIKWIKLSTALFDNRKIKQIRKMPDGDALIVIWMQLLCLAGQINASGLVYFSKDIPYTEEMLATEFDRPINTIRLALTVFQQFKMIEIVDNILLVSNWEKYQSASSLEEMREKNRLRQQKYREKQKELLSDCDVTLPVTLPSISISNSISSNSLDNKGDCKGEKKIFGEFEKVRLKDDEYSKLVERLGEDSTEDYITRLDGWLAEGHTKKNHYATILNWWRKDNGHKSDKASDKKPDRDYGITVL